jgi:hypothetical protein
MTRDKGQSLINGRRHRASILDTYLQWLTSLEQFNVSDTAYGREVSFFIDSNSHLIRYVPPSYDYTLSTYTRQEHVTLLHDGKQSLPLP